MIMVNNKIIKQACYPDNSLQIRFCSDLEKSTEITWRYEDDRELFSLICLTKHIRKINRETNIVLNIPYLPHARMDRVKKDDDIFTLKYFCEIINSLDFYKVKIMDVHSSVSEALLNNVQSLTPKKYIDKLLNKINISAVFYPDAGAAKRYSDMLNMPYCYGSKTRNWETGEILGLDVQGDISLIKGKDILIIDDICSKGGTFYFSAKKMKELGCGDIYLWVTHCENTILQGDLIKSGLIIKKVFTTNSIFTKKHDLIEIID